MQKPLPERKGAVGVLQAVQLDKVGMENCQAISLSKDALQNEPRTDGQPRAVQAARFHSTVHAKTLRTILRVRACRIRFRKPPSKITASPFNVKNQKVRLPMA
jgi:hypothetical protein